MSGMNLNKQPSLKILNLGSRILRKLYKIAHVCKKKLKAFFSYIGWILFKKHKLYKQLKTKHNLNNISPVKPMTWKHNIQYHKAILKDKTVFIKTGGTVNTVEREIYALTTACNDEKFKKYVPHICIEEIDNCNVVIEEWIEGKVLSEYTYKKQTDADIIIEQLFDIYQLLRKNNIYHLDIRPDNFMVIESNNEIAVKLIDFGYALVGTTDIYSYIDKNSISQKIISRLGSNYSCRNGILDDAYSMLLTMKYVCPSLLAHNYEMWFAMNNDIGTRIIDIREKGHAEK